MIYRNILKVVFVGVMLVCIFFLSIFSVVEILCVMCNGMGFFFSVLMNCVVVVESDFFFVEFFIVNLMIVDILILLDCMIYVLGKVSGIMMLILFDVSGWLIINVDVCVVVDILEFKEWLCQIFLNEKIDVCIVNDGIVFLGMVFSVQKLQCVFDLVECYVLECVSNLMIVGGVQQVMLKVCFVEM